MSRILAMIWPALRSRAAAGLDPAEAAGFDAALDALDELSPRVESPAVGYALVDVTGLGRLFGDEPRVAARAAHLVRGVEPLAVRLGIGDNRWLATVAASRAAHGGVERVAPDGGRRYLAPLPIRLLPADEDVRGRFTLFGLREIGQLADLPRAAVAAQFGVAGERLHALARGEDSRPLTPRRRPESVAVELPFDPPVDGLERMAFGLRRGCGELCVTLGRRHRAPGRARLEVQLEAGAPLCVEVVLPQPALEPDWIARLLIARLEATLRDVSVHHDDAEEPRIVAIRLTFDRLSDPWARQLPAFEPQAARWEELRWSLERMRSRFGPGRLRRALHERPAAALAERQSRFVDIGLEADAS
ncbi:MAG: hypothetical protein ABR509_07050 [Candidatus Limnocylindria bacterium]